MIPQYTLVKLSDKTRKDIWPRLPTDDTYVYMGVIPNKPGFCAVIGTETNIMVIDFQPAHFVVLNEEEI